MSTITDYTKLITKLGNSKELIQLTQLAKDFNKVRDETMHPTKRINLLIATILKATSFEERLTEIKIRLQRIQSRISQEKIVSRNNVMSNSKKFFTMTKKDQDFLLEKESKEVMIATKLAESKLEEVATALDYVRSANFNMKAVLAALKEYLNVKSER